MYSHLDGCSTGYLDFWPSSHRTFGHSDFWPFGLLAVRTSGHSDFWLFGLLVFQPTGPPNFWPSVLPDFCSSRLLAFRTSGLNSGLPTSSLLYFWPSILLAFCTSDLWTSGHSYFWPSVVCTSGLPYFWSCGLLKFWPSRLLDFYPSELLSFRTSVLLDFCPSRLLSFQNSGLPDFWPSGHLSQCSKNDILNLLCILHQSQIPNVLPVFALSRSLPEWPWASLHCWPCPLHKHPSTARCHPWPTQRPLTFGVESVSLLFLGPC